VESLGGRESRSGLAGVFIAAALEGAAAFGVGQGLVPRGPAVGDHADPVPFPGAPGGPGSPHPLPEPGDVAVSLPAVAPPDPADLPDLDVPADVDHSPHADAQPDTDHARDAHGAPDVEDAPHHHAAHHDGAGSGGGDAADDRGDSEDDDSSDDDDDSENDDSSDEDDDSEEEDDDDSEDGDSSDGDGDSSDGDGDSSDGDGDSSDGDGDSSDGDGDSSDDDGDTSDDGDEPVATLDAVSPSEADAAQGSYPGDGAARAEIAAWMGAEARKRGLPAELPVMAGLAESGLRNLPYGHGDSVGFFQMRTSVWDKGPYAGYLARPQRQLAWFLDHAAAVRDQRLMRGQTVDDPSRYGEWVADVERPAARYRDRYQARLEEARDLLRHGRPTSAPAAHTSAVADVAVDTGVHERAGRSALAALEQARTQLGTPYRWGGESPRTGFDCSGFVQWAYANVGIEIPRTSEQQILADGAQPVDREHLLPGDLVFFRDAAGDVHHVGMSLGDDRFINAPSTGAVVRIDSLDEPYYAQQFAGGRRFDLATTAAGPAVRSAEVAAADPAARRETEAALVRVAAEVQRAGTVVLPAARTPKPQ
jgi:cell wall-associated NlpC family hydrolase